MTKDFANNSSGNSLLPDGTKPLPKSIVQYSTYHQWGQGTITWRQFRKRYLSHQLLKLALKWLLFKSPWGQWVKYEEDIIKRKLDISWLLPQELKYVWWKIYLFEDTYKYAEMNILGSVSHAGLCLLQCNLPLLNSWFPPSSVSSSESE